MTKAPTPQEIEAARDTIARADAAAAKDRAERLKPVAAIVNSEAFATVEKDIAALPSASVNDPELNGYVVALGQVFFRLRQIAGE